MSALPAWLAGIAKEALEHRDRWPHALLISGPEGVGKRTLGMHFARALVCESPRSDGSACNSCDGCHYAAAGQHPDLLRVEPVDVDEEGVVTPTDWIKVDAIRALIEWTQISAHRRRAKVALIAPAEAMHPSAANALLKTLEEPPAGTFLMLASHRPGVLPVTVVSRCQRLTIPLPSTDQSLHWLIEQGNANAEAALAQAGGAPYLAGTLADPAYQAERKAWLTALAHPKTLSPVALAARIELAPRDERRGRLAWVIDWLIAWTGDLARSDAGGKAVRHPEWSGELAELAARVARVSLFGYHRRLLQQRAIVTHPLQPRLVAEALLLEYREIFT
ncbi:MAG TPA: DNA polymerase III subunit delta' [Casimicrobiaceae bacterium]|nr:DNA polymerase III subunit delta' [Casimicrobiaceae bacterium]